MANKSWLKVLAALVCVLLASTGEGLAQPAFNPPARYQTLERPASMVAGDFDSDGRIDLAMSHLTLGNMSILFGRADGTFGDLVVCAANPWPFGITAGDLNGDGRLDWAAVCDGRVTPGYNLGNRQFSSSTWYSGGNQHGIIIGDFSADGRADIASTYVDTSSGTHQVVVNYGQAGGTFSSPVGYTAAAMPSTLAAADLNRDGRLDFAVNSISSLTVLLRTAAGGYTRRDYSKAESASGDTMLIADLNKDSNLDVVTTNNSIGVFYGRGDGTFGSPTSYPIAGEARGVACADFDRDSWLDLAVTTGGSVVEIYRGTPAGFVRQPGLPVSVPMAIVATDLNGDGWPDLAVTEYANAYVDVFYNAAPEPATLALVALGGVIAFRRRPRIQ